MQASGHASPCWSNSAHADEGVDGDDVVGAVGVSVQLNERVLSSSSSYLLRVLHTSFAAGSKVALHHNVTKKTYERDGVLRFDVRTRPCSPRVAPRRCVFP